MSSCFVIEQHRHNNHFSAYRCLGDVKLTDDMTNVSYTRFMNFFAFERVDTFSYSEDIKDDFDIGGIMIFLSFIKA